MSDKKQRAKRLLRHYLKNLVEAQGHHWDSDNDGEVDEIVDCIIGASVEEAEEVEEIQPSEFDNFVAHVDNANRIARVR